MSIQRITRPIGVVGVGGAGGTIDTDAVRAFVSRWARNGRIASWFPDTTQDGFAATLFRVQDVALVAAVGSTFNNSFRHRTFVDLGNVATTACVLREALSSADGNATLAALLGFEVFAVMRYDEVAANQWGIVGAFASAGVFPFPDVWSLANQVGVGYTTLATATPIADLEAINTDGTVAGDRTRTVLAGARDVGQWIAVSVRLFPASDPGGARAVMRVRNLETGAETEATHTTNLPIGLLHAGIIHNVGAAPGGANASMSVAYFGVGYPV